MKREKRSPDPDSKQKEGGRGGKKGEREREREREREMRGKSHAPCLLVNLQSPDPPTPLCRSSSHIALLGGPLFC